MTAVVQESQLFGAASDLGGPEEVKEFGRVYGGRYRMPLLPGEAGVKSGGDWVPGGMMRCTRLANAFEDTEALNIWEQEQFGIGLVRDHTLYEELSVLIGQGDAEGVDWHNLKAHPEYRKAITGTWKERDGAIVGRAKQASGANKARQQGINRHTAWEVRAQGGALIGTPGMRDQTVALEALLAEAGLERVPGMQERVVRNATVNCAGRFDDVLRGTHSGRLYMSDLKTKRRPFQSWLTVDIQLAVYAYAEFMLEGAGYAPGPYGGVDSGYGVVLVMPSDGGTPYLRRADLRRGWANAQLARAIVDERSWARSKEREEWGHVPGFRW